MCTLTLALQGERSVVTSNRDENLSRPRAEAPAWHAYNGTELFFPRDPAAGGSWIAHNRKRQVGILLNGAFEAHLKEPPYRKSRGIVLLELMSDRDTLTGMNLIELSGVEPFTFIFLDTLPFELRWDGTNKHFREYPGHGYFMWSSSTLYTTEMRERRQRRFEEFLNRNNAPGPEELWELHAEERIEDQEGFVIGRNDGTHTVNRIQWVRESGRVDHRYMLEKFDRVE